MKALPQNIYSSFHYLLYGFDLFKSNIVKQNYKFIDKVFTCLLQEEYYTKQDLKYVSNLVNIVSMIIIPDFQDIQSLVQVEEYINQSQDTYSLKQIKSLLEYLLALFYRHKSIEINNIQYLREELITWRVIQKFETLTQHIVIDYLNWQGSKQFSEQSKQRNIQELYKFYSWLKLTKQDISTVNSLVLKQYIKYRALHYTSSTKNRIIQYLQPFFYFYKENINPNYNTPSYITQSGKSLEIYSTLSSKDINELQNAIFNNYIYSEPALMLYLMLQYGIPLKSLAVLKFNPKDKLLNYNYQNGSRLGIEYKFISVINNNKLVTYLESNNNHYIFNTKYSKRRNRSVSSTYIRNTINNYIEKSLGFKAPIQVIIRDYLRHKAQDISLPKYFELTKLSPLSRRVKLYYWLSWL